MDILAAIEHLRIAGGKAFNAKTLESARAFYQGTPRGTWRPAETIKGREVLILGTGPGVAAHRKALEAYVRKAKPYVLALNTQAAIDSELIDARIACHPIQFLADCAEHIRLPQPLITPATMLPQHVLKSLREKVLLDYGLGVKPRTFEFGADCCVVPSPLVVAYALAVATSGEAKRILMTGFDGYPGDDPRNADMQSLLSDYNEQKAGRQLISVRPTKYSIAVRSIYGM